MPGKMKTCPVCGKEFIQPYETIYKKNIKGKVRVCCGWNCYNKLLKNPARYIKDEKDNL